MRLPPCASGDGAARNDPSGGGAPETKNPARGGVCGNSAGVVRAFSQSAPFPWVFSGRSAGVANWRLRPRLTGSPRGFRNLAANTTPILNVWQVLAQPSRHDALPNIEPATVLSLQFKEVAE